MQLTPSDAFEQVKESLVQYLETAYKVAHKKVFAERGRMLRQRGVVAQAPFIEATPAFPTSRKLSEVERELPRFIPAGLSELVQHGVPVDRFPLYTHQEEALLSAFGDSPHLLVATGTGSGKTESFLLPILSDVLREAHTWPAPVREQVLGEYDPDRNVWLHSRRYERRPAGIRGLILYPMNALVNDQLSRLRRILARGSSPDWQRRNLEGNVVHFGMYTGLSRPAGSWTEEWRRDRFAEYMVQVEQDWERLSPALRDTGNWPRPSSPEMLCRWDMQAAPPDILVTNYSMLEYMLVRPIEHSIFATTRQWLHETPGARITLVLDEAHTYTGAKGTEVAHLVRRLKERLGIERRSERFRAIATSASIPNLPGADERLKSFVSALFDEETKSFSLIRLPRGTEPEKRAPRSEALGAFARFHDAFDIQHPWPSIEQLAAELDLGHVDRTLDPQVALNQLLERSADILWVRNRTARNATLLTQLAGECWGSLGSEEERAHATAGILTAGSFARPSELPDTPPLLSMRVHSFYRGVTGFWACMNPQCPDVEDPYRENERRPVGKLYTDARPWCSERCGSRVLELFTCRHCGLLLLGGIPDSSVGSLWPWSDDLSGERQDVRSFRIFGVERPHAGFQVSYRSTRTTLSADRNSPYSREVFEVSPATEKVNGQDRVVSPFPSQCPRCQNHRAPGAEGREVIEPLRTKGPQSFAVVVEEGFRIQPRTMSGSPPNFGRKALLFSDSRQEAAILAANLRWIHDGDLFRQLLYRVLHSCATCGGTGEVEEEKPYVIGQPVEVAREPCPECRGSGAAARPVAVDFKELRRRVIDFEFDRGIDPTGGRIPDFFTRLSEGDQYCYDAAETEFNVSIRRELSEDQFSLEPLGLASWRVSLPPITGALAPLTVDETITLIRLVSRILATENALLPPEPFKPWEWPKDRVKDYERLVIIPAWGKQGRAIVPYNLQPYRKLGRYVAAVARALVAAGRLPTHDAAEQWVKQLYYPLWNTLRGTKVLQWAGKKIGDQIPHGLRVDSFVLHPLPELVYQCASCAYVMGEALLSVCIRCGQSVQEIPVTELRNYYRLAALHALPTSGFDDPYPLRASEHTAQISTTEARDEERWFQDLFHGNEKPLDHRVDVLSVTTTMEMGIDIGSLLLVGLRNVPPSVANYQQRAGRAGRRGSALATVLTFAQQRSHDQYYFDHPPELVSDPPRVPSLYIDNQVIARRHVRSLVLHDFFYQTLHERMAQGLFTTWGTIADFVTYNTAQKLQDHIASSRETLIERCARIVDASLESQLGSWLDDIPHEVHRAMQLRDANDSLFEELINSGLLPKYAFPVDVVSLSIPKQYRPLLSDGAVDYNTDEVMQRDLKIALAEYAPGAEVVRQSFPNTYKYRSVGVYNPYESSPDYHPTGVLIECNDCQAVQLLQPAEPVPDECVECGGARVSALPYLRPPGFTVDAAEPNGGAVLYEGEGRERSGYTVPARLLVGQTAFSGGQPRIPFAPRLYTLIRHGDLFTCNKGPDRDAPGYLICPTCGRALDPELPGRHTYPADIPPNYGFRHGPRAGNPCPNRTDFQNQVILGHRFYSELILLGVDLEPHLDAPFAEASGKAVWLSFGTLIANAAGIVLQIDPGEIKLGARPIRRPNGRLHAEVFLYDDVPGGAGYARAIDVNVGEILQKALELAERCSNPSCSGACYHCVLDYRNQTIHPLLDRSLGRALLEYLLLAKAPVLERAEVDACGVALREYARAGWEVQAGFTAGSRYFPCVLRNAAGERVGLWVIHPLAARPTSAERHAVFTETGVRPAVHASFDLERRPFWVLNNLIRT